ncbi:MAG: hypothetical protein EOO61_03150 [Hymenobacter sp.]|nr:MAG: hypothetical protein EOO61_03150 [Hymenobacter sp.]
MKKNTTPEQSATEKRPKTELDEKFLLTALQVMKAHGFTSDRAVSIELGYRPDFINRVRNGVQSAPAAAWDALLSKYPEARDLTTNTITQSGANSIGKVQGDANYTITDCEKERDAYKGQVEQLRSQLADKERLIASLEGALASKEEIISLLRGGYNRPN